MPNFWVCVLIHDFPSHLLLTPIMIHNTYVRVLQFIFAHSSISGPQLNALICIFMLLTSDRELSIGMSLNLHPPLWMSSYTWTYMDVQFVSPACLLTFIYWSLLVCAFLPLGLKLILDVLWIATCVSTCMLRSIFVFHLCIKDELIWIVLEW